MVMGMAEYLFTVKDRQTDEILCQGSQQECAYFIGCEYDYIRRLAQRKSQRKYNTKYAKYKIERQVFGEIQKGGAYKKDVICCDCGLLMKNTSESRKRCPECARKRNNRSKAQRRHENMDTVPMPSPIRNPNAKYCEGCVYYQGEITKCCNYIFHKGKSRPCPPGKDCTVRIERKGYREKKERSTDIS
jgi:hypothetical protein